MTWTSSSPSRTGSRSSSTGPCSRRAASRKSRPIRACAPSTSGRVRLTDLLTLSGVSAGYGEAVVISGIDLALKEGEALAVLGRNGVGKTTLLNTIVGVTRHRGGTIALAGRDITRRRPEQRAHDGIGWVPQERNIFRSLTVEENLTAVAQSRPWA